MPKSNLQLYKGPLTLLTDMYQMTMSYGFWKQGLDKKESVFHLFFRKSPFEGGFSIAAGLELVVDFLENFHFSESDIEYLSSLKNLDGSVLFDPKFFVYLRNLKFTCDVEAVPEGSVVFPYEPLLRIKGPLIQCQLLESPLLNLINFSTLIATKAARICFAAGDDPVMEFGLRRAQGIDGAITASRSAYIGGCDYTSNMLAGKIFDIPVRGTHSHSWVMAFESELEAFESYAEALPNSCVFLVDTYDTIEGVKYAIEVGKKLRAKGQKLMGIRLDSGDLAYLSIKSRQLLDAAGFHDADIMASNELDETVISELKRQGAKITVWGVGTNLVTGKEQAALDGVYKLSAIRDPGCDWQYKLKLSEQMVKISNPGILQVRRFSHKGKSFADALYNEPMGVENPCKIVAPLDPTHRRILPPDLEYKDLLQPVFRGGQRVYDLPSLTEIRHLRYQELNSFPVGIKRFLNPHQYHVGMEHRLYDLKVERIRCIRNQSIKPFIGDD